jgi:predicted metal-dependent peptidase
VLAHEAWHIAFQHMSRVENRIFTIWNDAADYVINNMLKKGGYYMDGFPYLLDDKFNNWTTEQVYDYLIDNEIKVENPQDGDFFVPGEGPESMQGGMTPDQIAKKAFGNVHNASTASKMSKSHGDMPGEVKQMIDEFLKPKLPWQEIFINFFEALSSVEYSFSRPNRRYADPMLPSRVGRSGLELIHYYLDVSGSISNKEIQRFNSEVKYIKETYNPERLVLITFDTKLQDFYEFEEDDEFEEIVVTGRGGTNLSQVWAHAKEHQPNAMVVFTDLHVSIPTEEPGPPVIWVVSGNSRAEVPYGTLINIEED